MKLAVRLREQADRALLLARQGGKAREDIDKAGSRYIMAAQGRSRTGFSNAVKHCL
jgi:hypothetical protein